MEPARGPYEVLGVGRSATAADIRRAYRTLARRYHPDVNPAGDPHRFDELSDAYDVLHDPEKRARYDRAADRAVPVTVRRRRRSDVPRFVDEAPRVPAAPRVLVLRWRLLR